MPVTVAAVWYGFPGGRGAKEKGCFGGEVCGVLQKIKQCLCPPGQRGMEVWAECAQGNSKITTQRLCPPSQERRFPLKKAPCCICFEAGQCPG